MHSRCRRTTIALTPRRTARALRLNQPLQTADPEHRARAGGTPVPDIFRTLLVDGNDCSELITTPCVTPFDHHGGTIRLSAGHSEGLSMPGVDNGSASTADVRPGTGLRIIDALAQALGADFNLILERMGAKRLSCFQSTRIAAMNLNRRRAATTRRACPVGLRLKDLLCECRPTRFAATRFSFAGRCGSVITRRCTRARAG